MSRTSEVQGHLHRQSLACWSSHSVASDDGSGRCGEDFQVLAGISVVGCQRVGDLDSGVEPSGLGAARGNRLLWRESVTGKKRDLMREASSVVGARKKSDAAVDRVWQ